MTIYTTTGKEIKAANVSNTTAMFEELRMMGYEAFPRVKVPVSDNMCYFFAVCVRTDRRCYAAGEYDVAVIH